MARISGMPRACFSTALKLSDEDQDAIIDAAKAYRDGGLSSKEATRQAVQDLLVQAEAELAEIETAIEEQHPGALDQGARTALPDDAAFKRWFGDSKVVDENGEPLVVYHHGSFDENEDIPSGPMHFGTHDAKLHRLHPSHH